MLWLASQQSLHRCRLRVDGERLGPASVFPFFDDEGKTRSLMVTTEDSSRILLLEWNEGRFRRRGLRRNELRLQGKEWADASEDDAARVAHLWHFDPWWVLGEERYVGHPAVPHLKGTNIPGFDESYTTAFYDRSLSAVRLMGTGEGENHKLASFAVGSVAKADAARRAVIASSLPQSSARARRPAGARGRFSRDTWRLAPFWER